jgi:hypothetical protein
MSDDLQKKYLASYREAFRAAVFLRVIAEKYCTVAEMILDDKRQNLIVEQPDIFPPTDKVIAAIGNYQAAKTSCAGLWDQLDEPSRVGLSHYSELSLQLSHEQAQ